MVERWRKDEARAIGRIAGASERIARALEDQGEQPMEDGDTDTPSEHPSTSRRLARAGRRGLHRGTTFAGVVIRALGWGGVALLLGLVALWLILRRRGRTLHDRLNLFRVTDSSYEERLYEDGVQMDFRLEGEMYLPRDPAAFYVEGGAEVPKEPSGERIHPEQRR